MTSRRRTDNIWLFFGIFLMLVGILTYLYPEVTYSSKKASGFIDTKRFTEKTIEIPVFVSIGSAALGAYLIFNGLRINKRGG